MNTFRRTFLAHNKTKERHCIWLYNEMAVQATRIAKTKWGGNSGLSTFAQVAIHEKLLREGIDIRSMIEKEYQRDRCMSFI